MKERLTVKASCSLVRFCLFTVLLCMTITSAGASPIDASVFDTNEISVVQTNIKILDGTWIAGATEEALAAVESLTDHEVHLCILRKEGNGSYTVVSMSLGILSPEIYENSTHQLLDHLADGHPYFDITTDERWLYIQMEKSDAEEWYVSAFSVKSIEAEEGLNGECNLDTLSVWVYSMARPRINWPFLHEEMKLDHFDISSFAIECERALSYLKEIGSKGHNLQVMEIEW